MFYKNQPIIGFPFELVNKSTGDAITTGTVTGKAVLDDGVQTTVVGSAVHKGSGQWTWSRVSTTVTNGSLLGLMFTHASSIGAHFTVSLASVTDASIHALASASKVDAALAVTNQSTILSKVSAIKVDSSAILTDTGMTLPAILASASAVASAQGVMISDIFKVHGLDIASPMVNTPARRYNAASTLVQSFVGTADTSITVSRL